VKPLSRFAVDERLEAGLQATAKAPWFATSAHSRSSPPRLRFPGYVSSARKEVGIAVRTPV
jgi:hypothetical protein